MSEATVDPQTGLVRRPPPSPYPFGPTDLVDMIDRLAEEHPDKTALIDLQRQWTYRELRDASLIAAGALRDAGLNAGDRVAWTLPNCAELPIGFLASMRLALIWVGVNTSLTRTEQQFLLDDCGSSLHVDDLDQWLERLEDAEPVAESDIAPIDPHAPAAIAYTSGTTGQPKGAVHSQHNLVWPGLVTVETDPPEPDERHGTALAHTILNMMVLGPISAFTRASTAVILRRTDASGFSDAVSRYSINRTTVVPTMVHDLVHDPSVDHRTLSSLRHVVVGGAGTPDDLVDAFADRFGIPLVRGYGLSEAPTGVVRDGWPLPHVEVSLVDEEVCLAPTTKGPWADSWSPMLGYWHRPEETETALRGGVLHTGDLGGFNDDGSLFVTGRRSAMILRGGANIAPLEIETVLLDHPGVVEAAVFGVADERLGQIVAAAVVGDVDPTALQDHCVERLARYKIPTQLRFVPALPRNAMGKVDGPALAALLAATAED